MKQFVNSLVEDYNHGRVTWHEIQDIVEGKLLSSTNAHDYKIVDEVLQEIETQLKKGAKKDETKYN